MGIIIASILSVVLSALFVRPHWEYDLFENPFDILSRVLFVVSGFAGCILSSGVFGGTIPAVIVGGIVGYVAGVVLQVVIVYFAALIGAACDCHPERR